MNTKFAYTSLEGLTLDQSTEELMLAVDNFAYNVLYPDFASFGEIHDTLEIRLVSNSDTKTRTVHVSLGYLREDLKKKKELNKIIKEQNREIWETTGDESQLRRPYNTDHIEDILAQHQGEDDAVVVAFKISYERLGYYTRENGHGLIVLVKTRNENQMIATLIHEYMHAWADKNATGSMNDAEYAEEEIAEFGMLRFLQTIANSDTRFRQVLLDAIQAVKAKQHTYGLAHYGFGAKLYENYIHVSWERLLRDAHTLIGPVLKEYDELQKLLQVYPDKSELVGAANLLYQVLLAKQTTAIGSNTGNNSGNAGISTIPTPLTPQRNIFVSMAEAESDLKAALAALAEARETRMAAREAHHHAVETIKAAEEKLMAAKKACCNAVETIKAAEDKLMAAREKLMAAEEKLMAAEKAYHHAVETIKAAEEKLMAAEKAYCNADMAVQKAYDEVLKTAQEVSAYNYKEAYEAALEAGKTPTEAHIEACKAAEETCKAIGIGGFSFRYGLGNIIVTMPMRDVVVRRYISFDNLTRI